MDYKKYKKDKKDQDKKDDKKDNVDDDDDSEEEFKKKQKVHKVPLTRNKQAFGDFGAFKTKSKPAVKLNEPIKQKITKSRAKCY